MNPTVCFPVAGRGALGAGLAAVLAIFSACSSPPTGEHVRGNAQAQSSSETCYSATLDRNVEQNDCVQSGMSGDAYGELFICVGDHWLTLDKAADVSGDISCRDRYRFCYSETMQEWLPPRSCVLSKFTNTWHQCTNTSLTSDDEWQWDPNVGDDFVGPLGECSMTLRGD